MPSFSLFLPHPANIYITTNTFVKFSNEGVDSVGLIVSISTDHGMVTLRRFMCWAELTNYVGNDAFANISFWPDFIRTSPSYLCATDVIATVPLERILGIVFVFYVNDPILDAIQGMGSMYQVSSEYISSQMLMFHRKSFVSFPSQFDNNLPTCFPSSLFRELLSIKQKVQNCLSTRSLNDTFSESCRIDNINFLTWFFIIRDLPPSIHIEEKNVVVKHSFFKSDCFFLEKRRCNQQSFELYLPEHVPFVQSIFGTFGGIGSHQILKCTLKQKCLSARACNFRQISYQDEHNVVPFERDCPVEFLRRGIIMKYIHEEQHLIITVRFRKMMNREEFEPQVRLRNITVNPLDGEDERIPLHSDIEIFGKTIYVVNLDTNNVEFTDRSVVSLDEVINEFRRLYS
jgi:hypothetical protein